MDQQQHRSQGELQFTYDWYRGFLSDLLETGFDFRTFSEGAGDGDILLRHDVDLSIEKALTTARIEAEYDISSTYCFLVTSALYNTMERTRRDQIQAIEALGHEVALHFSTHEYWAVDEQPDDASLEAQVDEEREMLGVMCSEPPETVSFHIPPSWVIDRSFDGFQNTYGPATFSDIDYVADSGQRWRTSEPQIPDPPASVQILTHPGLWGDTDGDFEERVEQSIADATHYADQKTRAEFLQEVYAR